MNIFSRILRPFRLISEAADSLAAVADHLQEIADHLRERQPPAVNTGGGFVTGKRIRQFVVERSPDRRWRREIPLRDVLRSRTYGEVIGGQYEHRLELTCGVYHLDEHEQAVRRMQAAQGSEPGVSNRPHLLVGLQVTDKFGVSRALHLRDARLWSAEYRCDGFTSRMLAVVTFSGSGFEWGDTPTTNDPDKPREGLNVGEVPSIETAPATWAEN